MSRFWSPVVNLLTPYVAGEQPTERDVVKLNTNEHPYGPSPRVLAAISAVTTEDLRLYSDPASKRLCAVISDTYGVEPEQVFVGNGSDEVLAHSFHGLLNHDGPLLFPSVTYAFYRSYCRLYGIAFREVPLDPDMRIRVEYYKQPCGGIVVANPNAPTGIALKLAEIETLLEDHPDVPVLVDEAYVDFGGESAVPLVRRYANLLVVQTFSKSRGLAGLRVGFAIGQRSLIDALERVKDSFNSYPLGTLEQAGAVASMQDRNWFEEHRDLIVSGRNRLAESLAAIGFEVLPSSANFLFARHPGMSGASLAKALRDRSILVRHFSTEGIQDYLRITVGTDQQSDRLLAACKTVLR